MEKEPLEELHASYRERALEALNSAKDSLANKHLETAVSRAYYACFYAIHSQLALRRVKASSYKQTAIKFREIFIKTGQLEKRLSQILRDLSEWRMDADYEAIPDITPEKASDLVKKAEEFVAALSQPIDLT